MCTSQHCLLIENATPPPLNRPRPAPPRSKAIEQAGLPTTTPEERRRLLSFVVVRGDCGC